LFFSGSVKYAVDSKGRVNIPARFRNQIQLGDDSEGLMFYVTSGGKTPCLFVYPPRVFEKMAEKMEDEIGPILDPNENMPTYTELMASAEACRCDNQGRLIVPKKHLEWAQISGEVVIIGLGKRIQLWNPRLFEQYIRKSSIPA